MSLQSQEKMGQTRREVKRFLAFYIELGKHARGLVDVPEITMIIEMRTYKTKPGMRARFLEIFRSKSVPAHLQIGMKILGPFLSVEDPDTFFFMRGFPNLDSREPMKAKFYEGELWKREIESVVMPMLEKYEVVVVDDPENQIRW